MTRQLSLDEVIDAAVGQAVARHLGGIRDELAALRRQMPPKLIKVAEAAEALGVSTATVYRMINNGELPVKRAGRVIRVDIADLRPPTETEVEEATMQMRRVK